MLSHQRHLLAEHTRRSRLRAVAGSQGLGRPACRMCSLFTMSNIRAAFTQEHRTKALSDFSDNWWSQTGSNRRPPECKSGALPAELWPLLGPRAKKFILGLKRRRGRPSPWLPAPHGAAAGRPCEAKGFVNPTWRTILPIMVGLGRLERPTSPLSGVRSNHLSYRP